MNGAEREFQEEAGNEEAEAQALESARRKEVFRLLESSYNASIVVI